MKISIDTKEDSKEELMAVVKLIYTIIEQKESKQERQANQTKIKHEIKDIFSINSGLEKNEAKASAAFGELFGSAQPLKESDEPKIEFY